MPTLKELPTANCASTHTSLPQPREACCEPARTCGRHDSRACVVARAPASQPHTHVCLAAQKWLCCSVMLRRALRTVGQVLQLRRVRQGQEPLRRRRHVCGRRRLQGPPPHHSPTCARRRTGDIACARARAKGGLVARKSAFI